jgi:energy-converting hydrogenase Eha subunit E
MRRTFEVWFYIGALLSIYGVLLTAGGIYQWIHPPATVLANVHATFWAGILLLVIGGVYTGVYWPKAGNGSHKE